MAAAAAMAAGLSMASARAAQPECMSPSQVLDLGSPLPRLSGILATDARVKIVAFGSSSTAGAGASRADASYPARLQVHLRGTLGHHVDVVNRGRNGDVIGDMLSRLEPEVLAEHADLVIWQVGTNALLTELDPRLVGALLLRGLRQIGSGGSDVIVMDPQYAPKVIAHPQTEEIVRRIGKLVTQAGAALFRRFELMRSWHATHLGFDQFLSPDQLHMNDWSYDCLAATLSTAIARQVAAHGPARTLPLAPQ
jgi:lysophospholipase L1-like esterase